MTSSERPPTRHRRRFLWLAAVIVIAIAAYSGAWFWLAGELESRAATTIERLSRDGASAGCSNRKARGYPFRIGLFCDQVLYEDAKDVVVFKGDGLRSAAQIYDPLKIVGELDEIWLDYFGAGPGYGLRAKDVRFSGVVTQPLPERASVVFRDISVDEDPLSRGLLIVLRAAAAEAHMQRNGADVDLALGIDNARLHPPQLAAPLELAGIDVDLTVEDGVRLAATPPKSLRGMRFVVRAVSASFDNDSGLSVSGPVAIGDDGLIDAKLRIDVRNPKQLGAQLAGMLPERAGQIQSVLSGFATLGDNPSLPLTISKGRARIAFITLGDIPPLK